MRSPDGRWTKVVGYPESSDLSTGLRIQAGRTTAGRRRLVTVYRGVIFRLYPESGKQYYSGTVAGRYIELHRYIWECEVGPVPTGYHVHHRDADTQNNAVGNLECIPASEHIRRHKIHLAERPKKPATCIICGAGYVTTRPGRSEVCSRTCGNKLQADRGNKIIYGRTCPVCDKTFRTAHPGAIYCSRACSASIIQRHRRLAPKPCESCGRSFQPKASEARFCCRRCGVIGGHVARKAARLQP